MVTGAKDRGFLRLEMENLIVEPAAKTEGKAPVRVRVLELLSKEQARLLLVF
jgi:hypothetical protein